MVSKWKVNFVHLSAVLCVFLAASIQTAESHGASCSTGWEVRDRENVNAFGLTMVSPDNPFECNGLLTEWRYRSKFQRPFKAIVWRPVPGHSTRFEVAGINDIPAGAINQDNVHVVPEHERIEVKAGDMIGWSFQPGGWTALQYTISSNHRVYWLGGDLYNTLGEQQMHDIDDGVRSLEYSIKATVQPTARENCFTGWDIRNRDNVNPGGWTMVSPDNPFQCDGVVREWRYRSKFHHPFKAIVWRRVAGFASRFQIIGINDIPSGPINQNVVHVVPQSESIEVKAGDMIGWSFQPGAWAALQYTTSVNGTRVYRLGGDLYSTLRDQQRHDVNEDILSEDYSLQASVEPICIYSTQPLASSDATDGAECSSLKPELGDLCYSNKLSQKQRHSLSHVPGFTCYDDLERYVDTESSWKYTEEVINTLVKYLPNQLVHHHLQKISYRVLYPLEDQHHIMLIFSNGTGTSPALEEAKEFYLEHGNYINIDVLLYNTSAAPDGNSVQFNGTEWAPLTNLSSLQFISEDIYLMLYSDSLVDFNMSKIASVIKYVPIQSLSCITLEGKMAATKFPEFLHELKDEGINTVVADMREGRMPEVARLDTHGGIKTYSVPDNEVKGRYEKRVIIQFERDDAVDKAAQNLYGKHQDSSTLLWHDGQTVFKYNPNTKTYEQLSGSDLIKITAKDKIEIVGHGNKVSIGDQTETRLSTLTAVELSQRLQSNPVLHFDEAVGRIGLVACKISPEVAGGKFDMTFPVEFQKELSKTIKADVVTRADDILLTAFGQKRNAIDVTRKANKFVVKWSENGPVFDFVAGTRSGYEVSVLSGSGPLGNTRDVKGRRTVDQITHEIVDNADRNQPLQEMEAIRDKQSNKFTFKDQENNVQRGAEITHVKLRDSQSVRIRQFTQQNDVVRETKRLAEDCSSPGERQKYAEFNRKSPIVYQLGDYLYWIDPQTLYVEPAGFIPVEGANALDINKQLSEGFTRLSQEIAQGKHSTYAEIQNDIRVRENAVAEVFRIMYGLDHVGDGPLDVNGGFRQRLVKEYHLKDIISKQGPLPVLETIQLGTAALAAGIAESVRNYRTIPINMMMAELRSFSFDEHPMAGGGTWVNKDKTVPDTGYHGVESANEESETIRNKEGDIFSNWKDRIKQTRQEPELFSTLEEEQQLRLKEDIKAIWKDQSLGSEYIANADLDQIQAGLKVQEALVRDFKEIADKLNERFAERFPRGDMKDYEITKAVVEDNRFLIEVSKKQDRTIHETLEIRSEELSHHTANIPRELNKEIQTEKSRPASRQPTKANKLDKAMGYYGIAMGLQGGVRALEQGDVTHGLIGLGQFAHGVSGLYGFNDKLAKKAFESIQKNLEKGLTAMAEKIGGIALVSETESVVRATGKIARFGECVPFVGIGFGLYMVSEDIKNAAHATSRGERAHYIVDAVLDSTITVLDVLASVIPFGEVLEGVVAFLNVVRIVIDDVWNEITDALKKVQCPAHGTCFWKKVGAVFEGFFKGIKDVLLGFASIFYYTPYKELQHTKEFKKKMADYKQYYTELHKDGEPDIINFASGGESIWGGEIRFTLHDDHSAVFCYNLDGSISCHTIHTDSNDIVLGIGESQHIKYKTVKKKVLLFIPAGHVKVMDGLEGIASSLSGYYEGNEENNQFFAVQELPPDIELSYSLSDYFYELRGNGGDDIFHLGPQRSKVVGGNGADTYIIPKSGGHTVIDNFANDGIADMLLLEVPFSSLYSRIGASGDLIITYLDTHTVVVQNWLNNKVYQHLNFVAQPGVVFHVSPVTPLKPRLIADAIYLTHEEQSFSIDLSLPLYDMVKTVVGSNYSDTIIGNEQVNMINGGPGADLLIGGNGQDHYIVKAGEGCDIIDNRGNDQVDDVLYMDIPVDRIGTRVSGLDLTLYDISNSRTCATLKNWFESGEQQHLILTVTDFISIRISTNQDCFRRRPKDRNCIPLMPYEINAMTANSGQFINASQSHLSHVAIIHGSPYRDTIIGNENTNYITGGTGLDYLQGSDGADYYIVKDNEGNKIINNEATDDITDTLMFQVRFDQIFVSKSSVNILLQTTDVTVTVLRWFEDVKYQHLYVKTIDGFTFSITGQNDSVAQTVMTIDKSDSSVPVYVDTSEDCNDCGMATVLLFKKLHERMDDSEPISNCDDSEHDLSSTTRIAGSNVSSILIGNSQANTIQSGIGGGYYKGGNGSDIYDLNTDSSVKIVNNFAEDKARDMITINSEYSSLILSDQGHCTNDVKINGEMNGTVSTVIVENYKLSSFHQHVSFRTPKGEIFGIADRTNDTGHCTDSHGCQEKWYKNPTMIDVSDSIADQRITLVDYPEDEAFPGVQGSKNAANEIVGNKLDNNLLGGPFLDVLVGGYGNDVLKGLAGDDVLEGGDGEDILYGGDDNDWLLGGLDNDVIVPGFGTDMINGESGSDTVMYMGDPWNESGVMVNLALAVGLFSDAEADIVEDIENLYTSSYNDILIGSNKNNYMKSFGGNDILISLEGNDFLQGGDGSDFYVFDLATGYKEVDNCADDRKVDIIVIRKANVMFHFNTTNEDLIISVMNNSDVQQELLLTLRLLQYTADYGKCGHVLFQTNSTLMTYEEFLQTTLPVPSDQPSEEIFEYSLYSSL